MQNSLKFVLPPHRARNCNTIIEFIRLSMFVSLFLLGFYDDMIVQLKILDQHNIAKEWINKYLINMDVKIKLKKLLKME